jgi:hypothetical protein
MIDLVSLQFRLERLFVEIVIWRIKATSLDGVCVLARVIGKELLAVRAFLLLLLVLVVRVGTGFFERQRRHRYGEFTLLGGRSLFRCTTIEISGGHVVIFVIFAIAAAAAT